MGKQPWLKVTPRRRNNKGWLTKKSLEDGYTEQQAWQDDAGAWHVIELRRRVEDETGAVDYLVSHDTEATYAEPEGEYHESTHETLTAARDMFDHERKDAS